MSFGCERSCSIPWRVSNFNIYVPQGLIYNIITHVYICIYLHGLRRLRVYIAKRHNNIIEECTWKSINRGSHIIT